LSLKVIITVEKLKFETDSIFFTPEILLNSFSSLFVTSVSTFVGFAQGKAEFTIKIGKSIAGEDSFGILFKFIVQRTNQATINNQRKVILFFIKFNIIFLYYFSKTSHFFNPEII
jgi:hypothetical protein